MDKSLLKIRIILWGGLFAIVVWLLYMAVVPGGKIVYTKDFDNRDYFIEKFTPEERVETQNLAFPKLVGDPVYFSLRTPRRFNTARVTLKYKNKSEQPIIEAGVLVDKTIWRHELKPIENRIIDSLAMVWQTLEQDGLILLQRPKATTTYAWRQYQSVDEFLSDRPPRDEVALYHAELPGDYIIENYQAGSDEMVIKNPIRGAYQFYTYIKGEELSIKFSLVDINLNRDPDPVAVRLYYNNQLIDSRHLEDDGNTSDDGKVSNTRELDFKVNNLPVGVYKLELKANDDIVTKEIATTQSKIAFINKLWLAGNGGGGTELFTNATTLQALTTNPANLQKLIIADDTIEVNETYKQFSVALTEGIKRMQTEEDDIMLSGNGVFSFSESALIDPSFKRLDQALDINRSGINYVLANYKFPRKDGTWSVTTAEFDLSRAYREDGSYGLIFSIPGLRADDPSTSSGQVKDYIEVGEIKVELEGKTLWEKLFD